MERQAPMSSTLARPRPPVSTPLLMPIAHRREPPFPSARSLPGSGTGLAAARGARTGARRLGRIGPLAAAALVPLVLLGSAPTRAAILDLAVRDAIAGSADGSAYVVVLLTPVTGEPRVRRSAVAAAESRVLAGLAETDFVPAYRYQSFAALSGRVSAAGLARLAAHPDVAAIGLDVRGGADLVSSVPFIGAAAVQSLGIRADSITVAVLDSGIDTDHPDLADHVAAGAYHFLGQGADSGPGAEDGNGHGTNVAGIITSRGLATYPGVAPGAAILAVRVLDASGSGWLSDWAAGVDYVVTHAGDHPHLCVLNMSLGSYVLYDQCPCDGASAATLLLQAALASARAAGITTFCSSGNNGSATSMTAPACLSAATAVAAVYEADLGRQPVTGTYAQAFGTSFASCADAETDPDEITCFSNRSPCNRLAAPGRSIAAPGLGGGTSVYTGTSQASPHCAGTAALVAQARLDAGLPMLSPEQMIDLLSATGLPTLDPQGTSPNPRRVDALAAVDEAVPPVVALASPRGGESLAIGDTIQIRWRARDVIGVTGVSVQISRGAGGSPEVIGEESPGADSLDWVVTGPSTSRARVRVEARDAAGNIGADSSAGDFEIRASGAAVPDWPAGQFGLLGLAPNPVQDRVWLDFALPFAAQARIEVLDIQGRRVGRLADGRFEAGRHRLEWRTAGPAGEVSPGLYFVRLECAGRRWTKRLAVTR